MVKKSIKALLLSLLGVLIFVGFSQPVSAETRGTVPVFRVYNPNSGDHFFTMNTIERDGLVKLGWKDEGIAWHAPDSRQMIPGMNAWSFILDNDFAPAVVQDMYNPNAGVHHYTTEFFEVDTLLIAGWRWDNLAFSSATDKGVPVYRLYNPNSKLGLHFFTADANEKDNLIKLGWRDEGIGFYAASIN